MKRALRLRRSSDFALARREGRQTGGRSLRMWLRENGLGRNRYGIVAGKRIGIAVERNRVKRRLRALLMSLHNELRQGYDIVLQPRRDVLWQPFGELRRILRRIFAQAQLIAAA